MHDLTGATWRKALASQQGGECVEVAGVPGVIAIRDSKNPNGPALVFPRSVFGAFAAQVKHDQHGL
jgi:hypothetical protein